MATAPAAPTAPDQATLTAFFGAVFIGGTNYVAVKFSNEGLEPFWGATLRFSLAAVLFYAIARARRIALPRGEKAWRTALYGTLGFGLSYGLLYYSLVGLSAGTLSVILAATPLVTLLLAVAHGQERFSVRRLVGGLLAIAGLIVISAGTLGGDLRPIYLITALLAVVAIAESSVIVKSIGDAHPVTTNAVGMATGALLLAIASVAFGERWALPSETQTWLVLAWLVILGSVGLFMLFLFVIGRWTASASVYAITLMPVIAVFLGVLLHGEEISVSLLLGGILVIAAVYVGALSGERRGPLESGPAEPESGEAMAAARSGTACA